MKKIILLGFISLIFCAQSVYAANSVNSTQIEKIDKLMEKLIIRQLTNPQDVEVKEAIRKLIKARKELLGQSDSQEDEIDTVSAVEENTQEDEGSVVVSDENNYDEQQIEMSTDVMTPSQEKLIRLTPRRIITHDASDLWTPRKLFVSFFD